MQNMFSDVSGGGGGAQGGGAAAPGPNDDVPWWMKYAGKGAGIVGGSIAMFFGIWTAVGFSVTCLIGGIWQIVAGLVVILVEAPFCSKFIPQMAKLTAWVESRPTWQRGLVYLAISIPPVAMCLGIPSIIGSGCIFGVAAIYGMQVLGKKASRDEMAAAAAQGGNASGAMPPSNGAFTKSDSNMKSGLVGNIHGQDVEAAKQAT